MNDKMKHLDYAIGSFVPGAIRLKGSLPDPELRVINTKFSDLFEKNKMRKPGPGLSVKEIISAFLP